MECTRPSPQLNPFVFIIIESLWHIRDTGQDEKYMAAEGAMLVGGMISRDGGRGIE